MQRVKVKNGFTLIELLVVMAIIGILAALTLTGFNAARKNARDSTRKSDLAQYRTALEGYAANNNGNYPGDTDCVGGGSCDGNSFAVSGIFNSGGPIIVEYLPEIISDPSNSATYNYAYQSDGTVFTLRAALETGGWWQICSIGKVGLVSTAPVGGWNENCNL